MPTLQPLLARVEHLSLAPEVEHPQRLAGALRVPLRHRMPSTAMWTVEEIADLERLPHAASICNPQDNPGQRLNWGYWSTLEFAFQLLTTADETCNLRRQRGDLVLQFRFSPGRHLGGSRRDGTACWSHARCVFSPPMSPEDWRLTFEYLRQRIETTKLHSRAVCPDAAATLQRIRRARFAR